MLTTQKDGDMLFLDGRLQTEHEANNRKFQEESIK